MSEESFAAVRARVLAGRAAPVTAGRRRLSGSQALAAAAAVIVVVCATVSSVAAPDASAAEVLNRAADDVSDDVSADVGVGAGQYLHTTSRDWAVAVDDREGGRFRWRYESVSETWRPEDWRHEPWFSRTTITGRRTWIDGDEASATAAGVLIDQPGVTTKSAVCGEFVPQLGGGNECSPGSWSNPTATFVASLPSDPRALRAGLLAADQREGPVALAAGVLSSGWAPRDLRAALYRALAGLPEVEITDRAANLDGQVGTAFSSGAALGRTEMVINPDDGRFLGRRDIATTTGEWYTAGTAIDFTSSSTDVTTSHP